MKKIIFGKCYAFSGDAMYQAWLAESLALYADAGDIPSDVDIHIVNEISGRTLVAMNPKAHRTFDHGMLTSFPAADVYWGWSGRGSLEVEVTLRSRRGVKRNVQKLLSVEYASDLESFEQILHEFVLVPSTYFFSDMVPIHAACLTVNGQACLLAGTGGVGKSAAMLALRQHEGVGFVSDDISLMSYGSSLVYANMAWPKIYGYNCSDPALKGELLAGRGWVDRTHFNVKTWINVASTRRKLRPDRVYRKIESSPVPLSRLYYLVREEVSDFHVASLEASVAVEMTIAVISAEYSIFHDQLYWEQYNALATSRTAMLTMDQVVANWRRLLSECLASVACFKTSVPLNMDHVTYRDCMIDTLMAGVAEHA